jgi:hypothetical protein
MRYTAVILVILVGAIVSGAAAAESQAYEYPVVTANFTNETSVFWAWNSANTSYFTGNMSIYNGTYAIAVGGGGGPPLTAVPTQASGTNLTGLSETEKAANALMEIVMGAGKVVAIFAILGIVLGVLYQTGSLPTFHRDNGETNQTNETGAVEQMVQGQPDVQHAEPQEPQSEPEKKREKRDRYEVIKV